MGKLRRRRFPYRTRDDFERLYSGVGGPNYVWFQFRLQLEAALLYDRAGAAALTSRPPEVAEMVKAFRERRDGIVRGLNRIDGITCREPKGAFYVFPNITGLGLGDSATVQERILREAGIATLSGTAFGAGGEGHLRLSYANSLKNLQSAVTRIGEWAHAARQGRVAAAAGSVTSADR